jgi:hypothetical protein
LSEDPHIAQAIALVNQQSFWKIQEFLAAGCFANELGVEYEPPLVEIDRDTIVVSERLRFI